MAKMYYIVKQSGRECLKLNENGTLCKAGRPRFFNKQSEALEWLVNHTQAGTAQRYKVIEVITE